MQAPQRMQRSISWYSVPSIAVRPLSSSTTWYSSARPDRPAGAARWRRSCRRNVLAGRGAGQQAQDRRDVLQGRHDLLDGGDHDVDARQDLGEVAVAFIGDDDGGAGLGDEESCAGDADIRGRKRSRELAARFGQQRGRLLEVAVGSRWVWTRRKSASTWSRLTWTAGAMMWLGVSPRSWMMYSPRSVSTALCRSPPGAR
jgi:hypothetical protein